METDYLIVGAGASALAFLDVLLAETDAEVVIIDRRDAPGGHWNDAYPFVRLHQSATFYGVPSRKLEVPLPEGRAPDPARDNLSTKSEILHYFHDLMENTYLPTGRVTFLPMTEHVEGGRIRSLLTGEEQEITVRRKLVKASIAGEFSSIPATHKPKFAVTDGATAVPINDLPRRAAEFEHYCIMGAGKTAMDGVMWLLNRGIDPNAISWVRPNDYWLFCRENILPDAAHFTGTMKRFLNEMKLLSEVTSIEDFCDGMEAGGNWHRIDPEVRPTKFHAAVCSTEEVAAMRRVTRVLRQGHVTEIAPGKLTMKGGTVEMPENTLYIDSTASAGPILGKRFPPTFQEGQITLYMIRPFQPLFSAALIAFLEAHLDDDKRRNACARMVNFHDTPAQYIEQTFVSMANQLAWSREPEVKAWIDGCRLYAVNHIMPGFDPEDAEKLEIVSQFGPTSKKAALNIPKLLFSAS